MNEHVDLIYYQKNRDVILNKAEDYYKNNKEKLKMQARDRETYLKKKKIKKRIQKKQIYVIYSSLSI